jgi:type IV secretory pathway TraG/TraD family ATPase VirD4
VTGLDLAAHARAGKPASERSPFLVVADEFHTYMTRSFVSLLSEGRKFGVCAALAHQHAAQLDPEVRAAILGNAGTLAAFTLSAEDAKRSRLSLRLNCRSKIWSGYAVTTWRCGSCGTVRRSGP